MSDVSQILNIIAQGDRQVAGQLWPLVYDELRKLAEQKLAREAPGQTLQPTALVHEAYLRLVGDAQPNWESRGHFSAAAAEAMRRILVDRARSRAALKRAGGDRRVEWDEQLAVAECPDEALLALDEALQELEQHDPRTAQLVKLRYFSGLSHQDAAEVLGISRRVADRLWVVAKAWLFQRVHSG